MVSHDLSFIKKKKTMCDKQYMQYSISIIDTYNVKWI